MKKTTTKKKTNKKLISALGMFMLSGAMLGTSTYAWFTMSREVEVKNISMTATTPEDVQISLGHLTGATNGYAGNDGLLKLDDGTTPADNGSAVAPATGSTDEDMLDWTNSIEITEYYRLGRIIPASSTTGANIWFTPGATGVGKTVDSEAVYYSAATGKTGIAENTVRTGSTDMLATTLHAITNDTPASDVWNTGANSDTYVVSTGWNATNDDGYYVDIPVWLRTSSTDGVTLALDAYVIPKTVDFGTGNEHNYNDLYKAARVAIIPDVADAETSANKETEVNKLVDLKNGFDETNHANLTDGYTGTANIVDFYGRKADGSEDSTLRGSKDAAAGAAIANYDPAVKATTSGVMVNLTAADNKGTGTGYGDAKKYYIRVWLEGEDPECWNANAGQDFNISLKFTKIGS